MAFSANALQLTFTKSMQKKTILRDKYCEFS